MSMSHSVIFAKNVKERFSVLVSKKKLKEALEKANKTGQN